MSGVHHGDSAAIALEFHGAETGKASGPAGHSYAIPVTDSGDHPLSPSVISSYVESFLSYAERHPAERFFINHMGRGTEIASLFSDAPENCMLPGTWLRQQRPDMPARMIILDAGVLMKKPPVQKLVDQYLSLNLPLWDAPSVEIVSAGLPQSVIANDAYARGHGHIHRIIGENRGLYGTRAGAVRDAKAIWYATHLLSLTDPLISSRGDQIHLATQASLHGLMVDDLQVTDG